MKVTELCRSCMDGVCSTCDGTGFEMTTIDNVRQPKTYLNSEEHILCNCTLPESNGGLGQCNYCGGSGFITSSVVEHEKPSERGIER